MLNQPFILFGLMLMLNLLFMLFDLMLMFYPDDVEMTFYTLWPDVDVVTCSFGQMLMLYDFLA